MANEKVYGKGFYGKLPRQGAPDYVLGTLNIKVEDAITFLKENANSSGYVNFDILKQKKDENALSFVLNTFEPKSNGSN
jgi:hypothetical protein